MQYLITAPSLTKPTFETAREHIEKTFAKVKKLIEKEKFHNENVFIRVSITQEGNLYSVVAELSNSVKVVITYKDRDIRKAINMVAKEMKFRFNKLRDKKINKKNKFDDDIDLESSLGELNISY